jgi:hypothetical protein
MPITGHTTVKQFMDYICIDDEENLMIVSKHLLCRILVLNFHVRLYYESQNILAFMLV